MDENGPDWSGIATTWHILVWTWTVPSSSARRSEGGPSITSIIEYWYALLSETIVQHIIYMILNKLMSNPSYRSFIALIKSHAVGSQSIRHEELCCSLTISRITSSKGTFDTTMRSPSSSSANSKATGLRKSNIDPSDRSDIIRPYQTYRIGSAKHIC